MRIELADEASRERFTQLLADGLSPQGADQAQALHGDHLSVSGDDANLFVYADSPTQAERAHAVILAELEHHAVVATTSGVEHWLPAEERWDNEPAGETWEYRNVLVKGPTGTLMKVKLLVISFDRSGKVMCWPCEFSAAR